MSFGWVPGIIVPTYISEIFCGIFARMSAARLSSIASLVLGSATRESKRKEVIEARKQPVLLVDLRDI